MLVTDFLNYMETIKGKSKNTTKEYMYDLRLFLRFIKLQKGLVPSGSNFDEINISDIDINLIKAISLSDLYSFMSYLSRERDNNASTRARKVACIKSFFNFITNKAKILDYNPASELDTPKIIRRLPKYLNIDESKKLL